MDGGSQPATPDYAGAAKQTADGNLANLNAQTVANRPNQITPWGTSTWAQTPIVDQAGYNKAYSDWQGKNQQGTWVPATVGSTTGGNGESGAGTYTPGVEGHWSGSTSDGTAAPTLDAFTQNQWTQNLQLTPAMQEALNNQQSIQKNQSQLAQTLQGQVASTMSGGFHAPSLNDYMSSVGQVNQNFGGFNAGGQPINQNLRSRGQFLNTDISGATAGAGQVDLNAPQFSDANAEAGARAAYNSSHGMIADQQAQDTKNLDSQLRLQGLTPGTEAYNNAAQNLSRTQAQQNDQLANQAVLTGNAMANQNYSSALAGYGARNTAQGQAYGQGANSFALGNAALGQQYGQDANSFTQNNAARGQAFNQSLAGYGANQAAQAASNQAQGQAFSQGLQGYGTAYSSALQNYLQPLNAMNSVLTGQQVQQPNMPSFATAGYTGGADMTGAMNSTGSYNQGIYNSNQASASSTNGAIAGLAGAAAMAFF